MFLKSQDGPSEACFFLRSLVPQLLITNPSPYVSSTFSLLGHLLPARGANVQFPLTGHRVILRVPLGPSTLEEVNQ